MDRFTRIIQQIWCKIKFLSENSIQSIQPGSNVTIDNSDPQNPIISATGGGGSVTDQDNIPVFVDVTLSQILYVPGDTEDQKLEKLRTWILSQNFVIGEKEIWFFQLEKESTEQNIIPLSGTETGKPVTGDIELDTQNGDKKIKGNLFDSGINFRDDGTIEINSESGINVNITGIDINGDASTGFGIRAPYYYGENYDDNTYIQKKYVMPDVETTNANSYEISTNKKNFMLTINGTQTTITLPPLANNLGLIIFIKNSGEEESTIFSNPLDTVNNVIWEGGMSISETTVQQGVVMRIYNDGNQYTVI